MHASNTSEFFNIADDCLHARVREGFGNKVAVIDDSGEWTYATVQDRAMRISAILQRAGVRREERVLLVLPDSVDFVAALFGILGLGAVAVPVNPQTSARDLADLIETLGARAAFVHTPDMERFDDVLRAAGTVTIVTGTPEFNAALADATPCLSLAKVNTHRDDSAIWLFSSGSTGKPKIVMQSHRSFGYTTRCYGHGILRYAATDISISVPKLHFGYALGSNLLFPFSVGATVVLFADKCTPSTLIQKMRQHQPSVLITVPTLVARLLDDATITQEDMRSLRLATSAGEALPLALSERWHARYGVDLLDGLGTAEMWHIFISNRIGQRSNTQWPLGTLGQIVPGFDVRLCDDEGRAVESGEVGRMWVRGGALSLGYWHQHEASQAAFRGEWYVSNDMLSCDDQGFYRYHGRSDDRVKLSGQWFTPTEVEARLHEHADVQEAVVIVVRDRHGLTEPVAFVVLREGARAFTASDVATTLNVFLKERMAAYKLPRRYRVLESFPRTHLNKVHRTALRELIESEKS